MCLCPYPEINYWTQLQQYIKYRYGHKNVNSLQALKLLWHEILAVFWRCKWAWGGFRMLYPRAFSKWTKKTHTRPQRRKPCFSTFSSASDSLNMQGEGRAEGRGGRGGEGWCLVAGWGACLTTVLVASELYASSKYWCWKWQARQLLHHLHSTRMHKGRKIKQR